MSEFSRRLVECRQAAGFKTPHEFFKKSGGAKVLRVSFVSYWRMEKGRLLPLAERLPILLSCLQLPVDGGRTDGLLRAYLKALLRSETAYDWLMTRLGPAGAGEPASLQDVAVRRVLAESYAPLSRAQFKSIVRDYASYWAHHLLENDHRAWSAAELAGRLGVPKAALTRSLRALAAEKLVRFEADGRARSLVAGKYMSFPANELITPAERARIVSYRERMAAEQGSGLRRFTVFLRAYEPELLRYWGHLTASLQAAHAYQSAGRPGEEKPGPTAMFMVHAHLTRLFPY